MKKGMLSSLFFLIITLGFSQQKHQDSLQFLDYLTLEKKTMSAISKNDKVRAEVYINHYLLKAKSTNNTQGIARAFNLKNKMFAPSDANRLVYLDSALYYATQKPDRFYPAYIYFQKGGFFHSQGAYVNALDNYVLGLDFANRMQNEKLEYTIKFNIAFLKRHLGNYEEAEKIFLECLQFEDAKKQGKKHELYIDILFHLSSIYYESKKVDKCTAINKKGITLALADNKMNQYYHFVVNEGINLTIKEEYQEAIDSIEKGLSFLSEYDKEVANFYLAKSYYSVGKKTEALQLFKTIDTAFATSNDLFPPLRESYEFLISDAKEKNDKVLQLYYTNQLLKLDSVLHNDYKNLSKIITKKYDIPELLSAKEQLILELGQANNRIRLEKKYIIIISVFFCVLAFIGLMYYYRLKKQYKQRYEAIVNNTNTAKKVIVKNTDQGIGLDHKLVARILEELEVFEAEKHYLTNQITIHMTAKIVETNSKYLSKIINHYKGKNFSTYINDLRIDYIVHCIQHDLLYQKYTINAIAEEGGFSNREAFFRAFQKRTGLKPSYFIKKVRAAQENKQ